MLDRSITYPYYYEDLGLTPIATPQEIKAAYYKLACKYHPDKATQNKLTSKKAEKLFKKLGEAYAVLSNPEKRNAYDVLLKKLNQGKQSFDNLKKLKKILKASGEHDEKSLISILSQLILDEKDSQVMKKIVKRILKANLSNEIIFGILARNYTWKTDQYSYQGSVFNFKSQFNPDAVGSLLGLFDLLFENQRVEILTKISCLHYEMTFGSLNKSSSVLYNLAKQGDFKTFKHVLNNFPESERISILNMPIYKTDWGSKSMINFMADELWENKDTPWVPLLSELTGINEITLKSLGEVVYFDRSFGGEFNLSNHSKAFKTLLTINNNEARRAILDDKRLRAYCKEKNFDLRIVGAQVYQYEKYQRQQKIWKWTSIVLFPLFFITLPAWYIFNRFISPVQIQVLNSQENKKNDFSSSDKELKDLKKPRKISLHSADFNDPSSADLTKFLKSKYLQKNIYLVDKEQGQRMRARRQGIFDQNKSDASHTKSKKIVNEIKRSFHIKKA